MKSPGKRLCADADWPIRTLVTVGANAGWLIKATVTVGANADWLTRNSVTLGSFEDAVPQSTSNQELFIAHLCVRPNVLVNRNLWSALSLVFLRHGLTMYP